MFPSDYVTFAALIKFYLAVLKTKWTKVSLDALVIWLQSVHPFTILYTYLPNAAPLLSFPLASFMSKPTSSYTCEIICLFLILEINCYKNAESQVEFSPILKYLMKTLYCQFVTILILVWSRWPMKYDKLWIWFTTSSLKGQAVNAYTFICFCSCFHLVKSQYESRFLCFYCWWNKSQANRGTRPS